VAIGLTVIVALALPRHLSTVSDFILWVLFVLGVAPSILLAQYSQTLESTEATKMGFAIAGTMLMVVFLTARGPQNFVLIKRMEKGVDFWVILAAFSILVYVLVAAQTGLSFRHLALEDVYDVRSEFGAASGGSLAVGYLLPVQINIVNPLFIIKGVLSRRLLPLSAGILGQLIGYSTAGHKSTLFSLLAILSITLLYRVYKTRAVPGAAILLGVTALFLVTLIADRVTGGIVWTALFSRRIIIVPGALVAAYVDVFQYRPRQNFADIIPIADPYASANPAHIVGAQFVGDYTTAANVSLFGHGYLQMGYVGMFVEGAFLVVLLILANLATRNMPLVVSCVAFVGGTVALVSSSVFTTALTHGFFATIALCALAPAKTWYRTKSRSRNMNL
jgi:hypothetical protein